MLRRTPRQQASQIPYVFPDVRHHLLAQSGKGLRSEPLKVIARLFLSLDRVSVGTLSLALERIANGEISTDEEDRKALPKSIDEVTQLRRAFRQLDEASEELSQSYLQDRYLLKFWQQCINVTIQSVNALGADPRDSEQLEKMELWKDNLRSFPRVGVEVQKHLVSAAQLGLLESEMLTGIGERMVKIDEVARLETFEKVKRASDEAAAKAGTAPEDFNWTATLTALTGIVTTLCFIPIYLAWYHSQPNNTQGSPRDSDFWWLVQGSMMQLLGLLTLSVPIWQGSRLPSQNWYWTWFFVGIAALFTVLAVPLYLLAPMAFSSTLMFGAAVAQAFVTLQLALAANSALRPRVKERTQ